MITNFPNAVNGATTSGDYLSIFTINFKDSPYIFKVILTATLPDKISRLTISTTVYLNPYMAKFIVPPDNNLKYF